MTNVELLKAIVNGTVVTQEMEDKAKEIIAKSIEKANAKNSKAKEKLAKENAPLLASLTEYMTTHNVVIASEIATTLGVSVPKASALCKKMVELGKASVKDVKVKGKGNVKGYSLI